MKELDQKLMMAIENEDLETAGQLISQGADINAFDKWQNTALSNAVWNEKIRLMDFLYEQGAKIQVDGGHNLMIQAVFNAKIKSVKWLLDKGVDPNFALEKTGETPLHCTIVKRDNPTRTEIVKLLIEAGADVNRKTIPKSETACFMRDAFLKGETPLHRAAA